MDHKKYKLGDKIGGEFSVVEVYGGEGKSGMGVVYLVKDREAPFPYVLKTFQHRPGSELAEKFLSEARAWIQAGVHENLVRAFWVREIDSQLFIAAEYIAKDEEGRNTLSSYIRDGKLNNERILNWAAQYCYGMSYAMKKGVLCHRDIKPDNLMITPNGVLKVTDFGLAKTVIVDKSIDDKKNWWWPFGKKNAMIFNAALQTKTGSAKGTLPYMAPEQFFDSKSVDHRADIYSFGIVLYEMTSGGRYPYHKTALTEDPLLEFARLHAQAKPILFESPLIPLIERCLKKQREDRYGTYEDLLKSLKEIAQDLNIIITPPPVIGTSEDEELYTMAQSYVALKKPDKALDAINAFVSKFPERYCGWTEKSRIHLEMNEPVQAISAAKKSLSLNPYNSHAWNNLGQALSKQGTDFNEAKKAYEKAIEYDQQNTGAIVNLSILLNNLSEYDKIPGLLVKAIKLRPEKDTVCFNAGNIAAFLMKENIISGAKTILNALTEASPIHLNAWHNLALINLKEGFTEKAIKCFENVVRINPSDDFAWLSLAKIYFRSKEAKLTIRCCNELLKIGKSVTQAVSIAAQVLNYTGNYQGSIELIKGYLEQQPENDTWWFILSEIHEFRDNHKEALDAAIRCKKILNKYGNNTNYMNLKYVEERIRRLSEKP
ncbi:protein kinase [bacterium]|nr:protein kinase [bacterium]